MDANNMQTPQMNNNNNIVQAPQFNNNPNVQQPQPPVIRGNAEAFRKYFSLSVIFGLIYGFCLYNNHSSITYPIFMIAALVILKIARAKDGLSLITDSNGKRALGIFYVVSLVLLSIHRCMTTSVTLHFLERTAIFLLLFSFVIYLYNDTTGFDIFAWLLSILVTVVKPIEHIGDPFSDRRAYKLSTAGEEINEKKKTVNAVLIGLAITVPLLLVIVPLLSSADAVFENMLSTIFKDIDIPKYIYHSFMMLITMVFGFWCAYTIISSMAAKELKIKVKGDGKTNPVIAITFTSIIGIVYLIFCAIQLLYLFSGKMALPEGYTYAEYAHEGFYQLLAVCILNIVMVSICQAFFKHSKVLTALLTVIGVCTYIMIASSAMRMVLYIEVYHLTFMRIFVLWFLAVLCFFLAFLIISLYARKFPVFKACMVVITIAFIAFTYCNPEYQVAKYDLQATETKIGKNEYTSVADYITEELSYDAVPAYAGNQEMLADFQEYNKYNHDDDLDMYTGFRRFNFSFNKAHKYLKFE
ncbi:DUF4153 domain-containing protein [Butyrivibrio sp. CB08]|uniref:DUF4153 domain-containing protein n=1 Tax=Butyrivibrio sp. CB08 TaxID=2364879 RepID=UPI001313E297|nr:DUF4173 domain-containing protein [Butyrivibrio sp. CB08]